MEETQHLRMQKVTSTSSGKQDYSWLPPPPDSKELMRDMRQIQSTSSNKEIPVKINTDKSQSRKKSPKRQRSRDSLSPRRHDNKSPTPIRRMSSQAQQQQQQNIAGGYSLEGMNFDERKKERFSSEPLAGRSPSFEMETNWQGFDEVPSDTAQQKTRTSRHFAREQQQPIRHLSSSTSTSSSSSSRDKSPRKLSTPPVQTRGSTVEKFSDFGIVTKIMDAREPLDLSENETITVQGERGFFVNKSDTRKWKGHVALDSYPINVDDKPQVIVKKVQQVTVKHECQIRYLRPPTPPAPGDLIIRREQALAAPEAPPIVIRQHAPLPQESDTLIVREMPPPMPKRIDSKTITLSAARAPLPPRKVIIERMPQMPAKPQKTIIERWLPYKEQARKVVFIDASPLAPLERVHNVIIQWEAPKPRVKRVVQHSTEIIRTDPEEYIRRYGDSLRSAQEMPEFCRDLQGPNGELLAASVYVRKVPQLEGDLEALRFIDLEREGLGEYCDVLKKNVANSEHVLRSVFHWGREHCNSKGRMSLEDAKKMLEMLQDRLGDRCLQISVDKLLEKTDRHAKDGMFDFDKLKDQIMKNM